ncbi:metal-dependent hydrolase [Natrinema salifodinae]|uniref:LexA-binding, inner membrane-associated putative hydrolase n=1 Tax=Natrinema salifodinae TaxID=1202768 RepID=A0A1I0NQE9_9EURY|nr:metal-dependent hydrolase [Natrinema salifodinae]SEW03629.1 LexA-binding, inner membrane-associated putative hydrolase [Natrinema salifodinae]
MWPWGHLAVAYLLYTIVTHRRFGRTPRAIPAIAVAIGSQTPDLIDKPLAWNFGILPGGRTLAHSLFVVALLVPAVLVLADRLDRRPVGVAFLLGYCSHLLADIPPAVFSGEFAYAAYLLWPAVEQPPEDPVAGILDAFLHYYAMGPYEWLQFGLLAVAAIAWYRDGAPGLGLVRASIARRLGVGS